MEAANRPHNRFVVAERLKSRKQIAALYQQGKSYRSEPFSLLCLPVTYRADAAIQITFTAPKRRLKRAVDRNRAKRLMREAYRLNRHALTTWCDENQRSFDLMLIFRGGQLPDFHFTQDKIVLLLNRLMQGPNEKLTR
ncbi:MAG: ribonuclease P protein component [Bacteroidota bacterium]